MRKVLTPKQAAAKDAVLRWWRDPNGKQTFYFAGLGGTGKSTCVEQIVEDIKGTVLFAAFTGKAASVMRKKGIPTATTLHHLAYRMSGEPPTSEQTTKLLEEIKRLREVNNPGAQATADKISAELRRDKEDSGRKGPRFALNTESEIKYAQLLVVDECSFIDRRMGEDLESFGTRILALGDPAQLPPVFGQGYFTSREPDVFLDEILRQELDNPIRVLCEKARRGERLTYGKYGESQVLPMGDPRMRDLVMEADIVIVGRNRTRHAYNKRIRELLGRASPAPVPGDRVISLRNDHMLGLLNGTQWRVDRCTPNLDALTAKMEITSIEDPDSKDTLECETWLHHFLAREDELAIVEGRRKRVEMDFGNAITGHRSQGSEYAKVLVVDEGGAFGADAAKWRYTAFSRASQKLTVVQ